MTEAERNEVSCVASFRIIPRRQKLPSESARSRVFVHPGSQFSDCADCRSSRRSTHLVFDLPRRANATTPLDRGSGGGDGAVSAFAGGQIPRALTSAALPPAVRDRRVC